MYHTPYPPAPIFFTVDYSAPKLKRSTGGDNDGDWLVIRLYVVDQRWNHFVESFGSPKTQTYHFEARNVEQSNVGVGTF